MPQTGQHIHQRGSLVVPVAGTAATIITTYTVPLGFAALFTDVLLVYIGDAPPIEGDVSQLFYTLQLRGGQNVKDFEQVACTLGSLTNGPYPIRGGIGLVDGALLDALVTVPAGSPVGTGATNRVHAHLIGWEWPLTVLDPRK
jgi:hypothetical protein